ncbi:MAG: Fe-S-containing hydro-lyase [Clostridiales bacterium]
MRKGEVTVAEVKRIQTPLTKDVAAGLRAGDRVLISGTIYTGRDAAHKRLAALLEEGKELPLDIRNQIIYYVGPAPAPPGRAIGSVGPTSSYRMDRYAPLLIEKGLTGMIGKGLRGPAVIEAMKAHHAVYFAATGGAAVVIAKSIISQEIIAYEDLGTEAIHRLEVKDFPVIVAIDSLGNNLYETGREEYQGKGNHSNI